MTIEPQVLMGGLTGVACPSPSQCTAVDQGGPAVTFDPAQAAQATVTTIAGSELLIAVSCSASGRCTAIDAYAHEIAFDAQGPGPPTPVDAGTYQSYYSSPPVSPPPLEFSSGIGRAAVACPTATQCTAIAGSVWVMTWDPTAPPAAPVTVRIDTGQGGNALIGLDCPTLTQCTAVDTDGGEITFDPTAPGSPTSVAISPDHHLIGIACPSAALCVAIDPLGQEIAFNPAAPTVSTPIAIDAGNLLMAIACPSTSQCVAVDIEGRALVGDPTTPSTWSGGYIPGADGLTSIACTSPTHCVAVDVSGNAFIATAADGGGRPAASAPPSIRGDAAAGQELDASHGSWSPAPASYAYQWLDCDSSGNACQPATRSGATGPTYTLDASDAGSTIRLQVTASTPAGTGQPAVSAPTAVVTAPVSGPTPDPPPPPPSPPVTITTPDPGANTPATTPPTPTPTKATDPRKPASAPTAAVPHLPAVQPCAGLPRAAHYRCGVGITYKRSTAACAHIKTVTKAGRRHELACTAKARRVYRAAIVAASCAPRKLAGCAARARRRLAGT